MRKLLLAVALIPIVAFATIVEPNFDFISESEETEFDELAEDGFFEEEPSAWIKIPNEDGKVTTFLSREELLIAKDIPKRTSHLTIIQIPKSKSTNDLMKKIKSESKQDAELWPAKCYPTDAEAPGTLQTWCEGNQPYYTVVVEAGKIRMKESEREKFIFASLLGESQNE